jgi:hypothetical protein
MRKYKLLFLLSLILISCENEHNLIIKKTDVPLIIEVLSEGKPYYEYSYSDSYLVREEKSKFHYTKHNYDEKDRLISSDYYFDPAMVSSSSTIYQAAMNRKEWVNPENTRVSLTKTYEYENDGRLIRVRYIRPSVSNPEYTEFTIGNDMITRQSMYWQNTLSSYIDYFYDSKGNLLKAERYQLISPDSAKLQAVNEYEYDDMQNPFRSFRQLLTPGRFTNTNNIIKETYTVYWEVDPGMQNVNISEYTYEYNDMGYPVKVNGAMEYVYSW